MNPMEALEQASSHASAETGASMPGGDLVATGLEDLEGGRETVPALLVSMAAARLRGVGIDVPAIAVERPSHRLYELVARSQPGSAHSHYNALVRRIVSFARAAEHARAR
jgi:hypothetical protein